LLTENKLTHREIAKRVGLSAERVRQLELELLGVTGHEAGRERRQRKQREKFAFNVEPLIGARRNWYKREFYVNGKLCSLRRAYKNVGYKGWYTRIRRPLQGTEICVMELGQGRFIIVPMKEMPRSSTMFPLDEADSPTGVRGWRKYLNNWAAFEAADAVRASVRTHSVDG
jgi:hypothetical protein